MADKDPPHVRASVSGGRERQSGPVNRVSVSEPLDRQIAAAIRASVSAPRDKKVADRPESSTNVGKGAEMSPRTSMTIDKGIRTMSPRASTTSDKAVRTSLRIYTAENSEDKGEFPTFAKPAVNYGFREGRNSARRASQPVTHEEKETAKTDLEDASHDPPEQIPSILTHVIPRRETSPAPYISRESFSPIGYPPEAPL